MELQSTIILLNFILIIASVKTYCSLKSCGKQKVELRAVVTMRAFITAWYLPLSGALFRHTVGSHSPAPCRSALRDSPEHSLHGGSSGHDVAQLVFIGECLTLSSLTAGELFCWMGDSWLTVCLFVFPLSILHVSAPRLLAFKASDGTTANNVTEPPLYVTCCFSLAAFKVSLCLRLSTV